jgi:hypothetical protein
LIDQLLLLRNLQLSSDGKMDRVLSYSVVIFFLGSEFANHGFVYKNFLVVFLTSLQRQKYYFAWKLGEYRRLARDALSYFSPFDCLKPAPMLIN